MHRQLLKLAAARIVNAQLVNALQAKEESDSKKSLMDVIRKLLIIGGLGAGGYAIGKAMIPNRLGALKGRLDAIPRVT